MAELKKAATGKPLTPPETKQLEQLSEELAAKKDGEAEEAGAADNGRKWIFAIKDAGEFFGITRQGLQERFKAGCPKTGGYGKCNLKELYDWEKENLDKWEGDDASLIAVKRRYMGAKAEKAEMEVEIQRGGLIRREEVLRQWAWRLGEVRAGLIAFCDRLPPLLEGKTRGEMFETLFDEVAGLFTNFSREGRFCPLGGVEFKQQKSSSGRKSKKSTTKRRKGSPSRSGRKNTGS